MIQANLRAYSESWAAPTSFLIWGGGPGDRARLASALAYRIDTEPVWFQVEDSSTIRDPGEAEVVNRIPSESVNAVPPPKFVPGREPRNLGHWLLEDDVSETEGVQQLADFLRLPPFIQRGLEGRTADTPVKAVVVANLDRARPLWPAFAGGIRPFIKAVNGFAITLILAIGSAPDPNAADIDYLFQLEGDARRGPGETTVSCRQGAPHGVAALFSAGTAYRLTDLVEKLQPPGRPPTV